MQEWSTANFILATALEDTSWDTPAMLIPFLKNAFIF